MRKWAAEFRSAARADKLSIFRDHLKRLGLPNKPALFLEDTIQIVIYCSLYAAMDHQEESFLKFLKMQRYDPREAPGARYAFTFDINGRSYARVLVDAKMRDPDLADLYGHPWERYKMVGYDDVWISRPDWAPLSQKEKRLLQKRVEDDLLFDYAEDEIDIFCDGSPNKSALLVHVQDHLEPDEKGDLQPPDFMLAEMRNVSWRLFMRREKLSPRMLGASHA